MHVHPLSQLHYVHVIPDAWGAFVDIFASYTELSSRLPYVSVRSPKQFEEERQQIMSDERCFVVFWDYLADPRHDDRRAIVTAVYSEAIGEQSKMLDAHAVVLAKFRDMTRHFHGAFGHTPWMAEQMTSLGAQGHVLPVGWSPAAMGVPRWNAPKHRDLAFYGSMAGRRNVLVPYLKQSMPDFFHVIEGCFGRSLIGALENYKASLYVAHSAVRSFSTWRTWQHLCTSTAMMIESDDETDIWPLDRWLHFVKVPQMNEQNAEGVVAYIVHMLRHENLAAVAERAHKDLAPSFTVDRCVEDYLVPASIAIRNSLKQ